MGLRQTTIAAALLVIPGALGAVCAAALARAWPGLAQAGLVVRFAPVWIALAWYAARRNKPASLEAVKNYIGLPIAGSKTGWPVLFALGWGLVTLRTVAAGGEPDIAAIAGRLTAYAIAGRLVQTGAEEAVLRGWLLGRFLERGQVWQGVTANVALFVLIHALNPDFTALTALSLTATGVFVSLIRLRTGHIWGCWGFHAGWDLALDVLLP